MLFSASNALEQEVISADITWNTQSTQRHRRGCNRKTGQQGRHR